MSLQPIRKHVVPEVPDKLYFRIGDVSRLCEVPAYVLRFWETEFPQLRPNKGGTGQRLYRKRDVEIALRIKSLLYDQGYTIPGARQIFKNEAREREAVAGNAVLPVVAPAVAPLAGPPMVAAVENDEAQRRQTALRSVRDELCALLAILEQPVSTAAERAARTVPPQPMRPRLMLEPRPQPVPLETLRLVKDPRAQGDLFQAE